jgi:hypothetical protein
MSAILLDSDFLKEEIVELKNKLEAVRRAVE